jgi:hypothetical protein
LASAAALHDTKGGGGEAERKKGFGEVGLNDSVQTGLKGKDAAAPANMSENAAH